MSNSYDVFTESIKDAEELLAHFDRITGSAPGMPPPETEVLKRTGLIMAVTAWETYVEDRVTEQLDSLTSGMIGGAISTVVHQKLVNELKRFNTPDAQNVKRIFLDYTLVDVTNLWSWQNMPQADVIRQLNELIETRGKAAHRSKASRIVSSPNPGAAPHLVGRSDLNAAIGFVKKLVEQTELAL
jgi:hypothetical protein